jgi:CarD family transcriptional regulator
MNNFKVGDVVVYPSHGVGTITNEELQTISGMEMSLYVITFDKDRMTLKVPKSRAIKAGLRYLSNSTDLDKAIEILKSKPKVSRGMWSKRAQEYETKINSGSIDLVAEVLRDLHRNVDDPARSYSERVIYESALNRLSNEFAVAETISVEDALKKISNILNLAREIYTMIGTTTANAA